MTIGGDWRVEERRNKLDLRLSACCWTYTRLKGLWDEEEEEE